MQDNPYRAPIEIEKFDPRARSYRRAGTLIIWTIAIVYSPMVIGPLVAIFTEAKEPAWFLFAAAAFNGVVMFLMIQLGRFLRRRGKRFQTEFEARRLADPYGGP